MRLVFLLAASLVSLPLSASAPLILISVDGMSWTHFQDNRAAMPTLDRLAKAGASGAATTVFPSVTWPAHVSIVTGRIPASHGVVGNTYYDRANKRRVKTWEVPSDQLIAGDTLWAAAARSGKTTAAILWPATQKASALSFQVPEVYEQSDFVQGSSPGAIDELKKAGIPADRLGRHSKTERWELDALVADAAVHVVKTHRPDLLLVHFVAADTYGHKFGPDSAEMRWALAATDRFIAAVLRAYSDREPNVVVVSDHGFAPVRWRVDPHRVLVEAGIAAGMHRLDQAPVRAIANGYSLFLYGSEAPLNAAVKAFRARKLVEHELDSSQLTSLGLAGRHAPDRVLVSPLPYYFKEQTTNGKVLEDLTHAGMHGHLPDAPGNQATVICSGPAFRRGVQLNAVRLIDVAPTISQVMGIAIRQATGRVLSEALLESAGKAR